MMKKEAVKKTPHYTIDLTKIEGDGSFPCPKCGTIISPEDESEEIYKIVETKIANDVLVGLVVMCRSCGSTVKLYGFQPAIEGLTSE
jgi:predicted RNA-binding Zn-ribbon protein involved in translation (DUF1610 family)